MPSTVIRSFDYNHEKEELEITFVTGRRYLYHDVPPHVLDAFRMSGSKGGYFNRRIRDEYDFTELEPDWGPE